MFSFFDPNAPVEKTKRNLPHWEQPNVCYFITFRTIDALPESSVREFKLEREYWLIAHGIDPTQDHWHLQIAGLSPSAQREYHDRFSKHLQDLLDAGHGECLLRNPDLRKVVSDAFHRFDDQRYTLGDFVVMPNHVHLLVQFSEGGSLKQQLYSWKRFTARQINSALRRRGHFWQPEAYDHIVRSRAQWLAYRKYIAENPTKAKLPSQAYTHYRCPWEPETT